MLSIGYGNSLFPSIGIPTFAKLVAPNKILKKTCGYFGVICVHYIIVIFICQQSELSLCLFLLTLLCLSHINIC